MVSLTTWKNSVSLLMETVGRYTETREKLTTKQCKISRDNNNNNNNFVITLHNEVLHNHIAESILRRIVSSLVHNKFGRMWK
jgi:hypothetical protein